MDVSEEYSMYGVQYFKAKNDMMLESWRPEIGGPLLA